MKKRTKTEKSIYFRLIFYIQKKKLLIDFFTLNKKNSNKKN